MNHLKLSPRQLEVTKLAANGLSNKQIADKMDIHVGMVGRHLRLVKMKLNAKTMNQAIYKACKNGIICLVIVSMQCAEMRSYWDDSVNLDFTRARRTKTKSRRKEDGAELQHNVLVGRNMTI